MYSTSGIDANESEWREKVFKEAAVDWKVGQLLHVGDGEPANGRVELVLVGKRLLEGAAHGGEHRQPAVLELGLPVLPHHLPVDLLHAPGVPVTQRKSVTRESPAEEIVGVARVQEAVGRKVVRELVPTHPLRRVVPEERPGMVVGQVLARQPVEERVGVAHEAAERIVQQRVIAVEERTHLHLHGRKKKESHGQKQQPRT